MVSVGSHLCLYEFVDAANVVALTGSKYGSTLLGSSGPPLRLGDEGVTASDHVRLLGVTISSDLSPVKLVGTMSSSCFYRCLRGKAA